jgi:DNA-binding LacI/PurR family transcriptional regulator
LLFDRSDRPDAVFITDDNLLIPFLKGLEKSGVRPKRDVYVLSHCNWPLPLSEGVGVDHIGFDVREILAAGKECMDAQRAGDPSPKRVVRPRFASELLSSAVDVS